MVSNKVEVTKSLKIFIKSTEPNNIIMCNIFYTIFNKIRLLFHSQHQQLFISNPTYIQGPADKLNHEYFRTEPELN